MRQPSHLLCTLLSVVTLFSFVSPSFAQDFHSGLVGYYPLNETSGTTATDSGSGGNDGTMQSGLSGTNSIEGVLGTALNFDGSDDYINLGNPAELQITGAITVSAWVRPNINDGKYIVSKMSGSNRGYDLSTNSGTSAPTVEFRIGNSSSCGTIVTSGWSGALTLDNWHHVVGVYEPSTAIRIYVNGVEVSSNTTSIPAASCGNNTNNLNIGRRPDGSGTSVGGGVDEVRIYNRALTATDVSALYRSYSNIDYSSGLVGHWRLDQSSGTTVPDSSPSGHDGVFYNSPTWEPYSGYIDGSLSIDSSVVEGVDLPNDIFDNLSEGTITAWIKRDNVSNFRQILLSGQDGWFEFALVNGRFGLWTSGCSGGNVYALTPSTLATDTWIHVAYKSDANGHTFYMNGVPVSMTYTTGNSSTSAFFDQCTTGAATEYAIGWTSYLSDTEVWGGELDEIRVYDRVLSDADIFALAQVTGPVEGTLRFNDKSASLEYRDSRDWIHAGHGSYAPTAVTFDGTNDYLLQSGTMDDSKKITGSLWFKANTNGDYRFIEEDAAAFFIRYQNNRFRFVAENNAGTMIMSCDSSTSYGDSDWHHLLFSFDMENTSNRHIYVDGVSDLSCGTYTDDEINLDIDLYIGRDVGGSTYFDGSLADVWIDSDTYIDFSVEANRRKFISAGGMPMNLGANGSLVTGVAPDIFLSGDRYQWHENKGTGGGFTENGNLTEAESNPGQTDVTTGLVGHWKLDEINGAVIRDSAGYNDGVWTDNANEDVTEETTTGQLETALTFDQTDDYIQLPDFLSDTDPEPFTVCAWFNADSLHNGTIWNFAWNSFTNFDRVLTLGVKSTGVVFAGKEDNDAESSATFTTGTWNHVCGIFAAGNDRTVYLNGGNIGTDTGHRGADQLNRMAIGARWGDSSDRFFDGEIDDVRIYDRVLSEAEVQLLSSQPASCSNPTEEAGTVIYNSAERIMQYCNGVDWVGMGDIHNGAGAGCINPTGTPGQMFYNNDHEILQYCNFEDWIGVGKNRDALLNSRLEGHWKLDETSGSNIVDSSGKGNDGTWTDSVNDDVTEESVAGQVDYGIAFDATDDEIVVPNHSTLENFSEITLAAWVYLTANGQSAASRIISKSDGGSSDDYHLSINGGTDNARLRITTSDGTTNLIGVNSLEFNTWTHIAGTWDGSVMRLYVNGIEDNNVAKFGTLNASGQELSIGTHADSPTNRRFPGSIDDARVYSRALSAEEIVLLYGSTNPVDLTTGLEGHWTMDDLSGSTVTDSSGNGRNATWTDGADDDVTGESTNAQINGGIRYDGSDDEATVPAFDLFGTGLTIAAWVNGDDFTGVTDPRIVAKTDGTSVNNHDWALLIDSSSGLTLRLQTALGGGTTRNLASNNTPPLNTWTHVAATYNEDSGDVMFYVNGVHVDTDPHADGGAVITGNTGKNIGIGNNPTGITTRPFDGILDDVRVYSRPLGPLEIQELYELGAGSIVSGLIGHWPLDETSGSTINDASGNGINGSWTDGTGNDVTEETIDAPIGTGLTFDGSNDEIGLGSSDVLWDSSGPASLSFWTYIHTFPGGGHNPVALMTDQTDPFFVWFSSGNNLYFGSNGIANMRNTGSVSLNRWHHIVVTYNGEGSGDINNYTLYVDNTLTSHVTNGSWAGAPNQTLLGDTGAGHNFDGVIDDVRVYNRALSNSDVASLYALGAFVPSYGLLGHWTLDETSGSTITDSSGNGNDGTWTDGSGDDVAEETTSTIIGTGLEFDGNDDFILVPASTSLENSFDGGGTYSAWVYPHSNGQGSYGRVISKNSAFDWNNQWHIDSTGISFSIKCTGGYRWWRATGTVPHNQWTHIALVYDKSDYNNTPTFYVNGTSVSYSSAGSCTGAVDDDATSPLYIGDVSGGARNFDGAIDDVRIYDYALSASHIIQLYDIGLTTIPTSGLFGHWPLDETSGSVITDSVGSNNGTWSDGDDNDVTGETVLGEVNNAINLDGNDDVIELGNFDITGGDGGVTIAAWVNGDYFNEDPRIISKTDSWMVANHDWAFMVSEGSEQYLRFRLTTVNGFEEETTQGEYELPANIWTHVAVTYDPAKTSEEVTFFVNGLPVATDDHTFGGNIITGSGKDVAIGDNPASASAVRNWDGDLDDVRVYNRGLSAAEIRALYNATN